MCGFGVGNGLEWGELSPITPKTPSTALTFILLNVIIYQSII